ncbi:hypothetical protein Ahy_B01g054135 [Arachis hypogaea]|uniref:Putative plant transposon protein domain-containing protein n=1 Tax=Arachis hypogaea TaxID=3818 RepID=A0A445ATF5_ARAHY|nr:hypothetical protein Ahy_B01g054135 [Arachis hypogaea]
MLELRDLESHILRRQEEDERKFAELRAKMVIMVEAIGNMVSSRLSLCNQGTPIVECGEATKELGEGVNLKLHEEEEELKQGVQQEEEVEISEQKEVVVGCLGYVEHIKEPQVEEQSSTKFGRDVKKESDVEEVDRESKEIDQEVDSIITLQPPLVTPSPPPVPSSLFLPLFLTLTASPSLPLSHSILCSISSHSTSAPPQAPPRLSLSPANIPLDLGRINISWERELYCNFFRATLDSVQLRGREILITEAAIREALLCRSRTDGTCAYQQAEVAIHCMTFDYEALKRVIATPDTPWVMDSGNKKPKGMLFAYLSREAKTWQYIFTHYVLPTTHFSEIPMDMLFLIGCVMEGKEVDFSRLIRQSMWCAHIHGLLPFPTLVTSMIELADVPWEDDDVTPPPPDNDDKEVTISWGGWVHEKPPPRRCSRPRVVVEVAQPSSSAAIAGPASSSAATASLPPPPAPEPTYVLV